MNQNRSHFVNWETLIKSNRTRLLQRLTREFAELSRNATDEQQSLIQLIENKVINHVETLENVQSILANIGYALSDRRAFLLNMVIREPGM